jgi:hypothetical protein
MKTDVEPTKPIIVFQETADKYSPFSANWDTSEPSTSQIPQETMAQPTALMVTKVKKKKSSTTKKKT